MKYSDRLGGRLLLPPHGSRELSFDGNPLIEIGICFALFEVCSTVLLVSSHCATSCRWTRVVRLAPWRWMAGEAGRKLADPDFYAELPGLSVPYTEIAGTRGLRFGWLPFGGRVNDGLVAVDETSVVPTDQVIEVAASHTFMMNRRRVRRAVLYALDSHVSQDLWSVKAMPG